MLKNKTALSLSPLALLTLAACGGTTSSAVNGKVQKGPLENAYAFLDYNRDGQWTSGTDSDRVLTDADGGYTLTPTSAVYNFVSMTTDATIDDSTKALTGAGITLQAPKGSTVVTPMTTMVQNLITADEALATPLGVTADSAAGDIAAAMGFTAADIAAGFDPLTYDAYGTGADAPDPALALKAEKTSQKIMTVVNAFSAAGEAAGASAAEALSASFTALVNVVKTKDAATPFAFSLADVQAVQDAAIVTMTSAKDAAGNTIDATAVADFTTASTTAEQAIVNVAAAVEAVTDITDTADAFQVIAALESQVKTAAENVVSGTGATTIAYTTNATVTAAVLNKAPTDIVLKDAAGAAITNAVSIAENASSLVVVASMATTDATVGDTHVYSIAAGLDGASFDINASTGALSLKAQPDYETKTSYSVAVTSTDTGGTGKSVTETVTVSVTDDTTEGGAFGISTDTVMWTDYNPAVLASSLVAGTAASDVSHSVMTSTTGSQVSVGSSGYGGSLNLQNLKNLFDDDANTVGKSPNLHFTLDTVPTGSGQATIKATIIQGNDATRSGTESEISVEVTVAYVGDGTTATLTMPAAGTGAVSYTTAGGTSANFTVTNVDADAFSITAGNAATGDAAVLSVKMAALYDVFVNSDLGAPDMLRVGDYSIALETTLPLQNYANETVTKFTGLLEIADENSFDSIVGTDGADTITGTSAAEAIMPGAGKDTISTGGGADFIILAAGTGSTTLANANTVAGDAASGWTNGTDKFALGGDLTFSDLTVAADTTTAGDTNISITATGEYLMTVTGLAYGYITTDDFVSTADIV